MKKIKRAFILMLVLLTALFPASLTAYAVSRDTMVSKLLTVAENEVGYEGTSSYSKYGEWYGYQGGWCTTFALWCFYQTGEALNVKLYANIVPSGGNCNSMMDWFKNKGRYHQRSSDYSPQKGDLVFFDWSGNGSSQHVGIVTGASGSTVYTVEGNCSGKVKEKTYTASGSKPYASISSIMGYGSPNWSSVGTASPQTTKAPSTTTSSTKKETTKKAETTSSAVSTTKKKKKKQKKTTAASTETSTAPPVAAEDMTIYAATNELQIGDSVKLDYEVKPVNASAVVGYFCDEENIIEISDTGIITATGEGTATVVVCANDEIYRQCDFVVSSVSSQVTRQTPKETYTLPPLGEGVTKSRLQLLNEAGINAEKLLSHKRDYLIPLCIIGVTAALSLAICAVKAVAKAVRKNKE